jgi:hypothetical protein
MFIAASSTSWSQKSILSILLSSQQASCIYRSLVPFNHVYVITRKLPVKNDGKIG